MTNLEATKLTAHLATLYDVPAWTEDRIRAFAAAISDLKYAQAERAVKQYVATHRERPQPADLRQLVAEAATKLPGPEEAWGVLYQAIHGYGREQLHPAIHEAVRLLGHTWKTLGLLQYDKYPWLRRDFLSAYKELSERVMIGAQTGRPLALPDRAEARALLEEIRTALPPPTTPPVVTPESVAAPDGVSDGRISRLLAETRQRIAKSCEPVMPTAEQLERRRKQLRAQAARLAAETKEQDAR